LSASNAALAPAWWAVTSYSKSRAMAAKALGMQGHSALGAAGAVVGSEESFGIGVVPEGVRQLACGEQLRVRADAACAAGAVAHGLAEVVGHDVEIVERRRGVAGRRQER
jgi:hypothetical protein